MANVFLTGFMGTGKSAAGKEAAMLLDCTWDDLDDLIVKEVGMPISNYMKKNGEESFRVVESALLERWIKSSAGKEDIRLLSCGGGVILKESNRRELKENGYVIRLTASNETILERVMLAPGSRPMLGSRIEQEKTQEDQIAERISRLMKEREALYEQTADINISTDGRTPFESALLIAQAVRAHTA